MKSTLYEFNNAEELKIRPLFYPCCHKKFDYEKFKERIKGNILFKNLGLPCGSCGKDKKGIL